jgi:long-chain acyl-CoA synthetase
MTDPASPQSSSAEMDPQRLYAWQTGMICAHWAELRANAPAIVSAKGNLTFAELNARANQLARALRASGLRPGDAVALMCSNRPEFAEVFLATRRTGLRFTPINSHLTGAEAGYILDDCDAKAFIAEARMVESARVAAAAAPRAATRLAVGGEIPGFDSYEAALAAEDTTDIADPTLGNFMLYTSGTTGRPKGVDKQPIVAGTASPIALAAGYLPGRDLHLCTGPLYHAAPLAFSLIAPLGEGVGTVLMDGWEAEETLRLIAEHRITHTHMVPTMFHRLLSLPEEVRRRYDLSSLRFVLHGAAPCPVPVKSALIDWLGPIVFEYYAATEGAGTSVGPAEWLAKPGTVGKPADPDHVRILDDRGEQVPAGSVGTVHLKAPETGRFRYHKDEGKTSAAYRGDYYTLGDVGYLDEDGYLFLTDRSADLIISGGVNIYPAESEAILLTHPAVADVGVIGVPSAEWGEEVKAIVKLRPGVQASEALAREIVAFCRQGLAHYKCPRSVDFVQRLPRQDNGKLYKRALRQHYRTLARKGGIGT